MNAATDPDSLDASALAARLSARDRAAVPTWALPLAKAIVGGLDAALALHAATPPERARQADQPDPGRMTFSVPRQPAAAVDQPDREITGGIDNLGVTDVEISLLNRFAIVNPDALAAARQAINEHSDLQRRGVFSGVLGSTPHRLERYVEAHPAVLAACGKATVVR